MRSESTGIHSSSIKPVPERRASARSPGSRRSAPAHLAKKKSQDQPPAARGLGDQRVFLKARRWPHPLQSPLLFGAMANFELVLPPRLAEMIQPETGPPDL